MTKRLVAAFAIPDRELTPQEVAAYAQEAHDAVKRALIRGTSEAPSR